MHGPDSAHPGESQPGPPLPDLDAANQSLADALRKSFAILKGVMVVLVVAYVLSGWVRIQPGEVGFVVRVGRVTGGVADTIMKPGWHWSFPYPIDQVETVSTQKERLATASFLFQIGEEDRVRGLRRVVFGPLSPLRDNYLLTGDANILHAQMQARYRIVDPIAYVTNIRDSTPNDDNPPETELLEDVVCDAAIRVAARKSVKEIYSAGQQDYLDQVAEAARGRLKDLERVGGATGIEIVAVIGASVSGLEAILPPRQVQEEFDRVGAAEQQKIAKIDEARGKAREALNWAAGPNYLAVADAIGVEFEALLAYLRYTGPEGGTPAEREAARHRLDEARNSTDAILLEKASGDVQRIINDARTEGDRIANEALADHEQLVRLVPEYEKNGAFLLSRLQTEFRQQVLADKDIVKYFVPDTGKETWLYIPRDPNAPLQVLDRKGTERTRSQGFIDRNPLPGGRGPRRQP